MVVNDDAYFLGIRGELAIIASRARSYRGIG